MLTDLTDRSFSRRGLGNNSLREDGEEPTSLVLDNPESLVQVAEKSIDRSARDIMGDRLGGTDAVEEKKQLPLPTTECRRNFLSIASVDNVYGFAVV